MFLGEDGAAGSEGRGAGSQGVAGMEGGSAGSRDGGDRRGQRGMEEGGVGGPSAWSWELPARLDSHSLSPPRGFGKPHFFPGREMELQRLVLL